MAFPTSSLTNNQVHKEGNRAFVYDSALGVWDQVTETDRTDTKIITGDVTTSGNLTVTGDFVPSTPLSNRNLIINGGMQVWQRATATTTAAGNAYKTVDRWKFDGTTDGVLTSEKHDMSLAEIDATGHGSALQLDVTTADASLAAGQYAYFRQYIEAQNLQHLQYGTANAKTITLSFWVKSNKTGIYAAGILKPDTTAYKIFDEYTINAADTWEKKTITFTPTAGSTTLITNSGGIINNDNGQGFEVHFGLAWGSTNGSGTAQTWSTSSAYYASTNHVNWMDSTSNNFYLTGVQLEVGSNATPFEHRSYTEEFFMCNRYYTRIANDYHGQLILCWAVGTSRWYGECRTKNALRATPTVVWGGSGSWSTHKSQTSGVNHTSTTAPTIANWTEGFYHVTLDSGNNFTGLTDGGGPYLATFGGARILSLDAEL